MPTGTVPYSGIKSLGGAVESTPEFFYVYIKNEHEKRVDEILKFIKGIM